MGVVANDFDIVNLALDHLGITQKIANLNDAVEPARAAKRWYEIIRKELIRSIKWKFAEKRAVLVQDTVVANQHPHWAYAYVLPAGFFIARKIIVEGYRRVPGDWEIPFDVLELHDGSAFRLYTDYPPAVGVEPLLSYAIDPTTVADYPDHFVRLFTHALALALATPLRVDTKIVQNVWSGYVAAYSIVTASEEGGRQPDAQPDASWILARE